MNHGDSLNIVGLPTSILNRYRTFKMKLIQITILTLLFVQQCYAQSYSNGDTLHVVAINGLNLREGPSANSSSLFLLENGEKVVIVQSDSLPEDKINGFQGQWVKISSTNSSSSGYVFDAFISRYPVLEYFESVQVYIDMNWNDLDLYGFLPRMLEEYTTKVFVPEGCQASYSNGSDGEGAYSISIMQLNKNARLIKHGDLEGQGTELELSYARISEIYYLIRNIVKFVPEEKLQLDEEKMKTERQYGQVYVKKGEYPFVIRIVHKGGGLISILFYNACC